MKQLNILVLALLICIGCNQTKNATPETGSLDPEAELGFPVIDVTKQYPKSEKICLQDIADVEYIPLETNDDFLCGSGIVAYISDSLIIYQNNSIGEILIFDGNGKALKKINKKGPSGEEYAMLSGVVYDKTANELYVNDMATMRILVYDLNGKFKRSFRHAPHTQYSGEFYLFNEQYLLVYNISSEENIFNNEKCPYKLISKQTGEIIKVVSIPFTKRISTDFHFPNPGGMSGVSGVRKYAVKVEDAWVLNEISSDTIYRLSDDLTLLPVMTQTPSVQTMGETPQYIYFVMDSYQHQFLLVQKKEFDRETGKGFPTTAVMYDKKSGKVFEQNFYNADCPDRVYVFHIHNVNPMNSKQTWETIPAFILKKWLKEGLLTGKLKEVAEQIDEEDNPVIMIITFKQ